MDNLFAGGGACSAGSEQFQCRSGNGARSTLHDFPSFPRRFAFERWKRLKMERDGNGGRSVRCAWALIG